MFNLILNKYQYLFAVVPFVGIVVFGYFIDIFPKGSIVYQFIDKALNLIAEKNLDELLKKNGFSKTSVFAYQLLRIIFGIIGIFAGIVLIDDAPAKKIVICIIIGIVFYKIIYIFLLLKEKNRIAIMKEKLPYAIKTISYLAYVYPISNAIERAIDIVPKEYKYDLEILYKEISDDPITKKPYINFVNRYNGKLKELEPCLDLLYRMGQSGGSKAKTLLANLNETISDDINRVRAEKNRKFNSKVGWLGFIPVAFLVIVLIYLLLVMTTSVSFVD